jgi:hypothetical protein
VPPRRRRGVEHGHRPGRERRIVIRPGEPWGSPAASPPDLEVAGDDAALAAAVRTAPGALVAFHPGAASDLARAVGLRPDTAGGRTEVPIDAIRLEDGRTAANIVVLGSAPDRLRWTTRSPAIEVRADGEQWFAGRATTVVVANGQFLRGADLVPRGHPGDGRLELHVYAARRGERRAMRRRLRSGAHLPHPRIRTRVARSIEVRALGPLALEVDGIRAESVSTLALEVVPGAFRLLV